LAAKVHPVPAEEQVVEGQPRQGDEANRGRQDEARRPAGGGACQSRRPIGGDLRVPEHRDGAGRFPAGAGEEPRARKFFAALDSANRYAILHRIQDAKRPETRARRIEKYVAMLAEQKKLYPSRFAWGVTRCTSGPEVTVRWTSDNLSAGMLLGALCGHLRTGFLPTALVGLWVADVEARTGGPGL
jgi:hypothetical protein